MKITEHYKVYQDDEGRWIMSVDSGAYVEVHKTAAKARSAARQQLQGVPKGTRLKWEETKPGVFETRSYRGL